MNKIGRKIGLAMITLITIVSVFSITPAIAQTLTSAQIAAIQAQINMLLVQITALQAQLARMTNASAPVPVPIPAPVSTPPIMMSMIINNRGTGRACTELCSHHAMVCLSIGMDTQATDGVFWQRRWPVPPSSQANYAGHGQHGTCDTVMITKPRLPGRANLFKSPPQQWTQCRCAN